MVTPLEEKLETGKWYWIYREPENCTLMAQWILGHFVISSLKSFRYDQVDNIEKVFKPDWQMLGG